MTKSGTQNTAKTVRGNPDKTKPYRFPKGVSGNPGGRPKVRFISEALRSALESGSAEELANTLLKLARSGNVQALKEVADRTEGKPNQSVTVNGDLSLTVDDRKNRLKSVLAALGQSK